MASSRTQGTCLLCCDESWPCHKCLSTALGALLLLQGVITGVRPQPRMQGAQLAKPNICIDATREQIWVATSKLTMPMTRNLSSLRTQCYLA